MNTGELEFMEIDESGDFIDDASQETADKEEKTQPQEKLIDTLDDELVDFGELTTEDEELEDISPDAKGDTENSNKLSSPDKSLYINLAKALSEKGVINDFEESVFDEEDSDEVSVLMGLMQKTVDDSISEYKNQFGDSTKKIIEAIEQGLPIDEFLQSKNKELKYNNITDDFLEDEDNYSARKEILKSFYKNTTKFSDERIDKEIDRIVQLGEDVDESKDALAKLKQLEQSKADSILEEKAKNKVDSEKRYKESLLELEKEVNDIDLSFLGVSTNKRSRAKLYDMLTKPVAEENGVPINAINKKRNEIGGRKFDIILAALLDKGVFDGNLSGISAKQRKSAIEELQRSMSDNRDVLNKRGINSRNYGDNSADAVFAKRRH